MITKVKFTPLFISWGLGRWSIDHPSIYGNSELNVFKNVSFNIEIFSNFQNGLFEIKLYKAVESIDSGYKQVCNELVLFK